MALNQCQFTGNLGRDPEIRTTQSGDKCANLRLAVSEKWKDSNTGERRERTEWVQIVIWGPLAGVAEQYLRKGSKVFVSGKLTTRKWQDQSGADRYSTEVVLQGPRAILEMLDGPNGGKSDGPDRSGGYDQSPPQDQGGYQSDIDDEIPF